MKKLLGIVVLGLLLCGNAYAASDEKCSKRSSIASTEFSAKKIYWGCIHENKKKVKCGIKSQRAKSDFSAKKTYWSCKRS